MTTSSLSQCKPIQAVRYGARRLGRWRLSGRGIPEAARDGFTNDDLRGYPNNHNFVIDDGRLVPCFDLFWRWSHLAPNYTEPLESLLDIGSCRGWFVLEAAARPTCRLAVGIDVHEPFVELSRKVARLLRQEKAQFHAVFLRSLFEEPKRYGAPFQTILIINAYHYLYWGSSLSPQRFSGHAEIFAGLDSICSDRIIFANPVRIEDCPEGTREIASREPERCPSYTEANLLREASGLFDVSEHGQLGKRRLWVLRSRKTREPTHA